MTTWCSILVALIIGTALDNFVTSFENSNSILSNLDHSITSRFASNPLRINTFLDLFVKTTCWYIVLSLTFLAAFNQVSTLLTFIIFDLIPEIGLFVISHTFIAITIIFIVSIPAVFFPVQISSTFSTSHIFCFVWHSNVLIALHTWLWVVAISSAFLTVI